jgi:hypothetical protein
MKKKPLIVEGRYEYAVQDRRKFHWESVHRTMDGARKSVAKLQRKHPGKVFNVFRWCAVSQGAYVVNV